MNTITIPKKLLLVIVFAIILCFFLSFQPHIASVQAADSHVIWKPLGPHGPPGTPGSWRGAGRINDIVIDPIDSDTIWVGAASGGVWKTRDGGTIWTPMTDDFPTLAVSSIVIDPNDPNTIYVATGDKDIPFMSEFFSVGIIKSTDGLRTWEYTNLKWEESRRKRINKLLMHPLDSRKFLAVVNDGIYKYEFDPIEGDYKWLKKLDLPSGYKGEGFRDLEANPNNPDIWFASLWGRGVYKSVDAGDNWTKLENGLPDHQTITNMGRVEIAVSPSNPSTLYALIADYNINDYYDTGLEGLYRTDDNGENWFDVNVTFPTNYSCYPNFLQTLKIVL